MRRRSRAVRRPFPRGARTPPQEIVLDLDATDDPLHGHQEGRFFHGYYDCYCYLPLYVFLWPASARRSSDARTSMRQRVPLDEVERIVGQIRARWPRVKIVLRADSGFARDELMSLARSQPRRLRLRPRPQRAPGRRNRRRARRGGGREPGPGRPGAPVRRLRLAHARQLELRAARGCQGRAPAQRLEPALRRDLAAGGRDPRPHPLRGRLLRPRRGREPDQGLAWLPGTTTGGRPGAASSSTCSPVARPPPPCAPTSSGSGSRPSPTS